MSINDWGGEAFARPASLGNNYATGEEGVVVDPQRGMWLRDYFAAAALTGLAVAVGNRETVSYRDVAEEAYTLADEMLKAREET